MAQQSNDLRERLLAALPQPENLAAYREETATLLAKHARALRSDKVTAYTLVFAACALGGLLWWNHGGPWHPDTLALLQVITAVTYFGGMIYWVRHDIYASQISTLKEIKQVQLQILELQASLRKDQ